MKVFQVWDESDMAESDSFFPTKAEAMAYLRSEYEVAGDGEWDTDVSGWFFVYEVGGGGYVYLCPRTIDPTRAGICWALKHLPNR